MGSSTGNRKGGIQVAHLASGRKPAPAPICAWHDALWVMSCGEPARDARTDLCILHSKEANKDRGAFYDRVGEKLRARDYNFAGVIFPEDTDFSGKEFVNANFREAEFRGRADFSGAVLGGATNFFLAKFREAAVFSRARLDGEARFSSVEFGGAAYFTRAVFSGSAVFFKARFDAEASFLEAEFHGPAHFVRGKFSGRAEFAGAEFQQVADFHWASFSGETSFAQTVWGGNDTLTYGSPARPSFLGAASFFEANFGGKTYFAGNRLAGAVDFVRAQFAGAVFFTSRPLRPGVLPEPREVGKEAAENAHEPAELLVGRTTEGEEQHAPAASKEEQAPELCFEEVFLEQPQRVRFDNFDLRRTTLAGTNLRHAGFHNCRWSRKRGRFAVYDEVKAGEATRRRCACCIETCEPTWRKPVRCARRGTSITARWNSGAKRAAVGETWAGGCGDSFRPTHFIGWRAGTASGCCAPCCFSVSWWRCSGGCSTSKVFFGCWRDKWWTRPGGRPAWAIACGR